ncbi:MAG TPA: DUF1223 domain-containing protein [Patescibacteria group bacterium]|nr:DUF1223 domain-containing protein [Patescibacteria group bacterium]
MRIAAASALVLLAGWLPAALAGNPGDTPRVPVVVELFTSEGCSDCPPADALLAQLDQKQPVQGTMVIPLEEHVDYWDSQGWRDPFSSAIFTDRQQVYAQRFGSTPYTPEMVVAGKTGFVGSRSSTALQAIAAAGQIPQAAVALTVGPGKDAESIVASVRLDSFPPGIRDKANVRLAVTEDDLSSQVGAGENAGRHLVHRATVRKFVSAGHAEPGKPFSADVKIGLDRGWKRTNLHVVVFLEDHSTGQIFGAASARLAP